MIPRGVGKGLSTKVNANIGTSSAYPDIEPELIKLQAAIDAGADAVMDLSTGDNIDMSRRAIIEKSTVMVGTVPIYQATVDAIKKHGAVVDMTADDLLHAIAVQAKDGADFMTIHCGVTREVIQRMRKQEQELRMLLVAATNSSQDGCYRVIQKKIHYTKDMMIF